MNLKRITLFLGLYTAVITAYAEKPYAPVIIPDGYQAITIPTPVDDAGTPLQFGVGGVAFADDGTAFVAARLDGIWTYREGVWQQFAEGLHDPQGIHLANTDGSAVVVAQKPELTWIEDRDGDGRADLYRTINDAWRAGGNYCEYVHGPVVDAQGNYYISINLSDANGGLGCEKAEGAAMGTMLGYDGWAAKITPEGEFVPFAMGLRSAAGIGMSPDGALFITDNQGGWIPTSCLNHIVEGGFYGYPASMLDLPAYRTGEKKLEKQSFSAMRRPPALWLPHGELVNSPGSPVWDTTAGDFGPFASQVFIGCQTRSSIVRASLEKVGGEYQGAVFNFVDHLQSGCIRLAFDPSGRLWTGQTGRGWRSKGGQLYGLQRVEWDGYTVPFEMHSIKLTKEGFSVHFTRPAKVDTLRQHEAFKVRHWTYHYHGDYGSPKVDEQEVEVTVNKVSKDGRSVNLEVPLVPGRVYQITANDVTGKDGAGMSTTSGYYTLNRLLGDGGNRSLR